MISLGGAVGGIFVAVVAPVAFHSFIEFQICLAGVIVLGLVCLIRDTESWLFDHRFILPVGILTGIVLSAYACGIWIKVFASYLASIRFYPLLLLVGFVSLTGSYVAGRSGKPREPGFRFGQLLVGFVIILLTGMIYETSVSQVKVVTSLRNFYGVIQVHVATGKILMHGRTMHGAQLDPPYDRVPATYYGPDSGVGIALTRLSKRIAGARLRLGVVGLGAGTLAAYGEPGDYIRYYELTPECWSFPVALSRCLHSFAIPSRKLMSRWETPACYWKMSLRKPPERFDVLVLDAFSGHAIPVHLLTKEAFDTYWQHIDGSGIISAHISSRHVDLLPVIYGLARHYQVPIVISSNETKDPFLRSVWVLFMQEPRDSGTGADYPPRSDSRQGGALDR